MRKALSIGLIIASILLMALAMVLGFFQVMHAWAYIIQLWRVASLSSVVAIFMPLNNKDNDPFAWLMLAFVFLSVFLLPYGVWGVFAALIVMVGGYVVHDLFYPEKGSNKLGKGHYWTMFGSAVLILWMMLGHSFMAHTFFVFMPWLDWLGLNVVGLVAMPFLSALVQKDDKGGMMRKVSSRSAFYQIMVQTLVTLFVPIIWVRCALFVLVGFGSFCVATEDNWPKVASLFRRGVSWITGGARQPVGGHSLSDHAHGVGEESAEINP